MSVQLAILGFLQERNYHGYELKKVIKNRMGAWTDIKFGSIYHALGNLEKAGHVKIVETSSAGGKPARSIYAITEEGQVEFQRRLRLNITSMQMVYLKEDLGIYFGGKLDKNELYEIIQQRIQAVDEVMKCLENHIKEIEKYAPNCINLARWLVKHHLLHLETEKKWFASIMQELMSGKLYPAECETTGKTTSSQ